MIESDKLRVPADTRSCVKNFKGDIDNFNLLLNKYVEFDKSDDVVKGSLPESKKEEFDKSIQFVMKQRYILEKYKSCGYEVVSYEFKPYDKIVIGLGQESVREVSLTLHWIYGIPFIPGQAIKGVVSNWISSLEDIKNDNNFIKIFGTEDENGKVVFLDSYPKNGKFSIKRDIMNPHYPEYYLQSKAPSDWQNPNPVFFLTVERVIFNINLVYLESGIRDLKIKDKTLEECMIEAFSWNGIGAKTSIGYGKGELILIGGSK
ncbi:MAG: type III-B CRISPR module RAMP protein Cmr6 [Thermoanaerobacterium sp.]|nr:type III-B CRISPR module RAMP protein Cmr6 [Thermoanaerobacterium sp.]